MRRGVSALQNFQFYLSLTEWKRIILILSNNSNIRNSHYAIMLFVAIMAQVLHFLRREFITFESMMNNFPISMVNDIWSKITGTVSALKIHCDEGFFIWFTTPTTEPFHWFQWHEMNMFGVRLTLISNLEKLQSSNCASQNMLQQRGTNASPKHEVS